MRALALSQEGVFVEELKINMPSQFHNENSFKQMFFVKVGQFVAAFHILKLTFRVLCA